MSERYHITCQHCKLSMHHLSLPLGFTCYGCDKYQTVNESQAAQWNTPSAVKDDPPTFDANPARAELETAARIFDALAAAHDAEDRKQGREPEQDDPLRERAQACREAGKGLEGHHA